MWHRLKKERSESTAGYRMPYFSRSRNICKNKTGKEVGLAVSACSLLHLVILLLLLNMGNCSIKCCCYYDHVQDIELGRRRKQLDDENEKERYGGVGRDSGVLKLSMLLLPSPSSIGHGMGHTEY